jgi:hypothetical protein
VTKITDDELNELARTLVAMTNEKYMDALLLADKNFI